jgi:hypothetical protein
LMNIYCRVLERRNSSGSSAVRNFSEQFAHLTPVRFT